MKITAKAIISLIMISLITVSFTACFDKTDTPDMTDKVSAEDTAPASPSDLPAASVTDKPDQTAEAETKAPEYSRVSWPGAAEISDSLKQEVGNYGSLNIGKNTVSNNNSCYAFSAFESGFYNIEPGNMIEIAIEDKMISNNAVEQSVISFGFPGDSDDGLWHYAGEEVSTTAPVYLEKDEVIYIRFYDLDVENEMKPVDGMRTASIDYLGEITAATFDLGSVCLDDCKMQNGKITIQANTPAEITFSSGQRYKKTVLTGTADSLMPGERTVEVDISRGHGFKTKAAFYRLEDVIEKVEMPASYIPMVSMKIGESEGKAAAYPDYINVTLKDGSLRKAERIRVSDDGDFIFRFNYSGDAYNTLYLVSRADSSGRPVLNVVYYNYNGTQAKETVIAEYDAIRT